MGPMSVKSEPWPARTFRVLIVDDDPVQRRLSEAHVARAGGSSQAAGTLAEARACLSEARERFSAVLLDLGLPDGDGLDLLRSLRGAGDGVPVVVQTGEGRLDRALEAMRAGATDFLVKPVSPDKARAAIEAAIRDAGEDRTLASEPPALVSAAMRPVLAAAERVSRSMVPILLLGETGVGKEWLARRIVKAGARADRPFVPVNCGALPRDLAESILFGFERGAFTGAERRSPGKFTEADGGTLFLDEVGDLAPDTQVKLLRALQDGEIDPIGAARPVRVDLRIVAATHKDLRAEVAAGRFREDLFYRLDVFALEIPPLRERGEEIPALARAFAARHLPGAGLEPAALDRLRRHRWPGNIRELENAVRRATVMADGLLLRARDFALPDDWMEEEGANEAGGGEEETEARSAPIANGLGDEGGFPSLAQVERAHILQALQRCGGQPGRAAKLLGIGRTTLYRKLREYGLSGPESGQ